MGKQGHFSYGRIDIENTLTKRDIEILKSMRINLCEIAGKTFPDYSEKVPINRKAKNKIANDIFNLGFSIINKNVSKDMENVYQKDSGIPDNSHESDKEITDLAQLLSIVATMKIDIDKNKKEIATLKAGRRV